jgi:hypothetical protein
MHGIDHRLMTILIGVILLLAATRSAGGTWV